MEMVEEPGGVAPFMIAFCCFVSCHVCCGSFCWKTTQKPSTWHNAKVFHPEIMWCLLLGNMASYTTYIVYHLQIHTRAYIGDSGSNVERRRSSSILISSSLVALPFHQTVLLLSGQVRLKFAGDMPLKIDTAHDAIVSLIPTFFYALSRLYLILVLVFGVRVGTNTSAGMRSEMANNNNNINKERIAFWIRVDGR